MFGINELADWYHTKKFYVRVLNTKFFNTLKDLLVPVSKHKIWWLIQPKVKSLKWVRSVPLYKQMFWITVYYYSRLAL